MNPRVTMAVLAVLAVWSGVLTYLTLRTAPAPLPAALSEGTTPVVAFVRGDSLRAGFALVEQLEDQLMKRLGSAESGLAKKLAPLQKEAQELINYANSPDATDSEIQFAQMRLAEIEKEAAEIRAGAEGSLVEAEQVLQDTLAEILRTDIEVFAAEQGIDIVVNWGLSGEGVLYGSEGFDVTGPLIEFLNARHPVEAKPKP
jgi:hypothetical protein